MGFSITNPDLVKRERRLRAVDIGDVARRSAATTATAVLLRPLGTALRQAARDSGAGQDVRVHRGHENELVMRDRGHPGDVIVGVDGSAPTADQAEELEWGGIDTPPTGWVRTTAAELAPSVVRRWGSELSGELDRAVLGRR